MHKYKYTIIFIITFVVAFFVGRMSIFNNLMGSVSDTSKVIYTFITGAFYSFSFTSGVAVVLFSKMTIKANEILLFSMVGALGGLLADLLILRFIKNVLFHELGHHVRNLINRWTHNGIMKVFLFLVGCVIVASPFPDEIGLTLMGLSKTNYMKTIALVYLIDVIGTFIIIATMANIVY